MRAQDMESKKKKKIREADGGEEDIEIERECVCVGGKAGKREIKDKH